MRVYVYPGDRTGCGLYRMKAPALALKAQGYDVHVVLPDERTGDVGLHGYQDSDGNLVHVEPPRDADVMVLQRVTMGQLGQAIPLIRQQGIAVVVDMDDDLTCVDPRNVAWTEMHPRMGKRGHTWANATQACMDATLVTVSTPALLKVYAPHGRGVVLDNYIPEAYLNIPHDDSDLLGWAGSIRSHPGDLPVVGASVARLIGEGHRWLTVGDGLAVREPLGLQEDPPATGLVPLEGWAAAVAQLGVGIAPLADTKFNRSKSRLKALEMSAVGVPWVASPRTEYTKLHQLGCGVLVDKPRAWYRELKALAADPARRMELSAAGRAVAAEHTIEANAWRWAEAWAKARLIQNQAAASAFSRV